MNGFIKTEKLRRENNCVDVVVNGRPGSRDIAATVYDAVDVEPPGVVDGYTQQPIHGKSFAYAFEPDAADEPSVRKRQYYK